MLVAWKVIESDRWLSVQRVTGQVTRGRCGDGSGVTIRNDRGRLVEIQLGSRRDHRWGHVVVTKIACHKAGHHMIGKMNFQKGHDNVIITIPIVESPVPNSNSSSATASFHSVTIGSEHKTPGAT